LLALGLTGRLRLALVALLALGLALALTWLALGLTLPFAWLALGLALPFTWLGLGLALPLTRLALLFSLLPALHVVRPTLGLTLRRRASSLHRAAGRRLTLARLGGRKHRPCHKGGGGRRDQECVSH
jgi:hypothetical protein